MDALGISVDLETRSYAVNAEEFRAQNAERGMSSAVRNAFIDENKKLLICKITRQRQDSSMAQE